MLDDLAWAAADLEHATTLYEQGKASESAIDESWPSGNVAWHIRSWQDQVPVGRGETVGGLWDVSLTARSASERWTFSRSDDGWNLVEHEVGSG
jgi:hypothetical protein